LHRCESRTRSQIEVGLYLTSIIYKLIDYCAFGVGGRYECNNRDM
jgi:hypothetical protein